ncbi:hypothetical protein DLD77_07425 [Chitinophaga alhagiae]|uniref:Phytoene synthase n=1 Tax=Chitinophaga alhagiae TaxID=2203219 RepID=A0ABM6WC80_9BACT|nr:hypothetical protein [Chitinophaga alhagiae]AWO01535.1 hypothetical protein DLD77_07425 [Chitinophaga alhagiae]
MPPSTVNTYNTARHLYLLHRRLKKQRHYIKQRLPPLLQTLHANESNESFPPSSIRRFSKYWELSLNVVCDSLYLLMNKQLSQEEHERILLLSIFGLLYDDLFDEKILPLHQLEAFTLEPEKHRPASFTEHAVKQLYLRILTLSPCRNRVIAHLHQVFNWQKASLKQMSAQVGEEELYEITYKKSYYSILLCYSTLNYYPPENVRAMLYPMAGLLQLTNDAFDVYRDLGSGIYTVPNRYLDFDKIMQKFLEDVALFNTSLAALPFQQPAKNKYSITIHALHAMGWMALKQLKENARGVQCPEELAALGRKALVCDMDSFSQKARWVRQVKQLVNYQ